MLAHWCHCTCCVAANPLIMPPQTPLLGTYHVCALYMAAASITGHVSIPTHGVSLAFTGTTTGRALNYRACDAAQAGA